MLVENIIKFEKKAIEKGRVEGRIEGIEKGIEKGKIEGKIEVARKLKDKGFKSEEISEITGLSIEEIEKL